MKPLERLSSATTPTGSLLELFRHDGAYLIRADGVELMSTRRHHSEDALAELACAAYAGTPGVRVLVGGLGLGFTLRAALRVLAANAEVWVAELLPEVIAWNADPAFGISVDSLQDPRVRVVQGDVTAVLRAHPGHFHAIMLDTDNGPDGMLMQDNAPLYTRRGIHATKAALCPGGTIAYWSVADDPRFAGTVEGAGLRVATHRVRAHVTSGPWHTIYVATPRVKQRG
jgi:spermidine synthase